MTEKITKQELKQPDRFQILTAKVMLYLTKHKKEAVLVSGALVLVVLVVAGWYVYDWNQQKSAMALYNKASEMYAKQQSSGQPSAEILKLYQDVVKEYAGTRAGAFAAYRLGYLHLGQLRLDESAAAFEGYLKHHGSDNELGVLVYNGLGYVYEQKKAYPKALDYFQKALNTKTGPTFASTNHENIARAYEALKEQQKALENYKKALEKAVDPAMKEILQRKIATLG